MSPSDPGGHTDVRRPDRHVTYRAVVRAWGRSIESVDTYTHGHSERVADYAVALARTLGLDDERLSTIRLGAHLHDVGKIRVPRELLTKAGPLTRLERRAMQQHPVWGVELVAGIGLPADLEAVIRWHHERCDGSGYPDGLRGDQVPLSAQIVAAADVYDALTSTRPYRRARSHAEACREIARCREWWSRDVFDALLASVSEVAAAAAA